MKKLGRGMLSALLLIGAPAVAQVHWDMPTAYSGDNFHTQNIKQFARDVEEATKGQFKITVHDSASLYKATEIKRAVQTGQAEIGEIYLANFNNENAIYGLDTIPFVADNYGEARKLNDVAQPVLDKLFDKQRMKLLFSVPWPLNGIYSVKTIHSGADLRGMKWRAYNSVSGRMAELLHAQPVTIQAAELSQALATGAVEAFMTSSAAGYDSKVWEQVKYFYNSNISMPKNFVIVNNKAFNALDDGMKKALLDAAAKAQKRGWQVSEEKNQWYLGQLSANGMSVETPTPQLEADLKKIGHTMLNEWLEKTGAEGKAIIDAYRAK